MTTTALSAAIDVTIHSAIVWNRIARLVSGPTIRGSSWNTPSPPGNARTSPTTAAGSTPDTTRTSMIDAMRPMSRWAARNDGENTSVGDGSSKSAGDATTPVTSALNAGPSAAPKKSFRSAWAWVNDENRTRSPGATPIARAAAGLTVNSSGASSCVNLPETRRAPNASSLPANGSGSGTTLPSTSSGNAVTNVMLSAEETSGSPSIVSANENAPLAGSNKTRSGSPP